MAAGRGRPIPPQRTSGVMLKTTRVRASNWSRTSFQNAVFKLSLSFTGTGGETLGERGYSKDHRPDLMQMIVGVVIDAAGRPVCSEMWPGNTADVSVLVPVIDRLRRRFAIGRVCVVADRGMISAPTIAALEERGLEY